MLTASPLISRTLRRLGFDCDFTQHAARSWEIEPACKSERLAAVFDDEDLQKVTLVAPHTTLDLQVEQLRAGSYQCSARKAHLLKDVSMVGGHFFKLRMVHSMAHRPLPAVSIRPTQKIEAGVLGTSEYGNKYFGHWFCDDVLMSRTAQQFGTVYGHVNADNRLFGHQPRYADLFDWNINLLENAHFRELTILDWSPMTPRHGERFVDLRSRLPIDRSKHNPGVMLLRATSGQQRVLSNELQIAEIVRARGFEVLDPMTSTVDQLVRACSNARVVMGVEGSHLAHGFLPLAPGGTLFTFQPPFKFDNFWKGRCDCVGARYAFVVGTQTSDAGFEVDAYQVQRMLDRVQA